VEAADPAPIVPAETAVAAGFAAAVVAALWPWSCWQEAAARVALRTRTVVLRSPARLGKGVSISYALGGSAGIFSGYAPKAGGFVLTICVPEGTVFLSFGKGGESRCMARQVTTLRLNRPLFAAMHAHESGLL
jgi:hypothetical protein